MIFISQQNEYFAMTIFIFSHFAIVLTMTNKIAEFRNIHDSSFIGLIKWVIYGSQLI